MCLVGSIILSPVAMAWMASVSKAALLYALLVCLLAVQVQGRNQAPKVNIESSVEFKAPSTQATKHPPVPEDHIFYSNYQANFTWNTPGLQRTLYGDTTPRNGPRLGKRNPFAKVYGPAFNIPSCLGCIEADAGIKTSLSDFSTSYFEGQLLYNNAQLKNKCLFYSAVEDLTDGLRRRFLPGADRHRGLSKVAADWACGQGMLTIWVS